LAAGEASPGTSEVGVNEVNLKTASSSPSSEEAAILPAEVDEDEPSAKTDAFQSEQQPQTRVLPHALDSSHSSEPNFWLHMTETLDACFNISTDTNNDQLLGTMSDDMIAEAPRVIQIFLSHGDACTKIEASALDLVANGPNAGEEDEPLKAYTNMLDDLGQLQEKASMLESTIIRLADAAPSQDEKEQTGVESDKDGDKPPHPKQAAHSELKRVFAACLPVLRARIANLTMAQDLIDSAQENLSISLRMEDLGIN